MDKASYEDILKLEPVQQWCAYYMQDKLAWADVFKARMQAAASLGDHEKANQAHIKMTELLFPYVAEHRRRFEEDASELLKSLRGTKIVFRKADTDPARAEAALHQASRR